MAGWGCSEIEVHANSTSSSEFPSETDCNFWICLIQNYFWTQLYGWLYNVTVHLQYTAINYLTNYRNQLVGFVPRHVCWSLITY